MQDLAARYQTIAGAYTTLSYVEIRSGVRSIVQGLTKAELKCLGVLVGLCVSRGTLAEMQETFAREICENKCSYQRCQFTFGLPSLEILP